MTTGESAASHEGNYWPELTLSMCTYRRYLGLVQQFLRLRAEAGEPVSVTLGARNGAWPHKLVDTLAEVADDRDGCLREIERLENAIEMMGTAV